MELQGAYGDGRAYALPAGWKPVAQSMLDTATHQALAALGAAGSDPLGVSVHRVSRYYAPDGGYAGNLFMTVEETDENYISASDLWAVSTLSMDVPPLLGRRLLTPGTHRTNVTRQLRKIPTNLPLSDVTSEVLTYMWDLQDCLRSTMSTETRTSNWWVFAAKMCARKRPLLFPVRDSLVCSYLSAWKPLGGKEGRLGWFSNDIQVFAYLMTSAAITSSISSLRAELLATAVASELDWSDMRLLDVAVWMAAKDESRKNRVSWDEEAQEMNEEGDLR